ncbi:MAG: acetyl-CoA hydrolase/transferase family protein [Lachnospiraceae bacterium]|nr:acetyl-CoA hydrolase/transferase family protein [Lachnospiraceae bacterium]
MSDVQKLYHDRLCTPEEALEQIKDGDLIAIGCDALEPITMLSNLHKIHERINEVTIHFGACSQHYEFLYNPEFRHKFQCTSRFFGRTMRDAYQYGNVSLIPLHFHGCITRYAEVWHPDVIMISGTRMDEHGYINLSLGGWEKHYLDHARAVIVEVVDDMPNVPGEFELHISQITAVIESGRKTPTNQTGSNLSETDLIIGRNVAKLVEDGSTIQLGIGNIPDAVAQSFKDKNDLGVHTELLTNSICDLAELGVVNNTRKTMYRGKTVAAFCIGSSKLYNWIDRNPGIYMMPISTVNNPFVIAQQYRMVSINTCIEVDLTGQIASESIGTRQWSGTGGANDFAEGAIHSPEGKSIIAMPSSGTNRAGKRFSKIKAVLSEGAVVSISRNNIDYIVTEYGIAEMKCRTIRQRVENLISIAHPDFRDELREDAKRWNIH